MGLKQFLNEKVNIKFIKASLAVLITVAFIFLLSFSVKIFNSFADPVTPEGLLYSSDEYDYYKNCYTNKGTTTVVDSNVTCFDISETTTQVNKVYAYLYDDGMLVLDGSGNVYETYSGFEYSASEYKNKITKAATSITGFAPSRCTSLFKGLSNLTSVDLSTLDLQTNNCKIIASMFSGCSSLTSIDFTGVNTSGVTHMGAMFDGCSSLTSITFGDGFDTSYVENFIDTFRDTGFKTLDLSGFNTVSVKYMSYMFYGCTQLKSVSFGDSFNLSHIEEMQYMFYGCSSLESIDLGVMSNTYNYNLKSINNIFDGCTSLKKLNLSNFSTLKSIGLFSYTSLTEIILPKSINSNSDLPSAPTDAKWYGFDINNQKIDNTTYTKIPQCIDTNTNGTFESGELYKVKLVYDYLYLDSETGTKYYTDKYIEDGVTKDEPIKIHIGDNTSDLVYAYLYKDGMLILDGEGNIPSQYTNNKYNFKKPANEESGGITIKKAAASTNGFKPNRLDTVLRDLTSLTRVDFSNFDTSNVTSMSYMLNNCSSLTSLDLSNFDTRNVTNMSSMFNKCSSLTSLNVSNFDTSKVTNMYSMFNECNELTSITFGDDFDTSNVTSMDYMFYKCSSLTSLVVNKFNTSNVTNMSRMFGYCSSLTSLDLSNFDTRNVTDMASMFSNCSSLTSLDVSDFDTRNVTDMSNMFSNCSSLTSLDVSKFNTSNVTLMNYMFSNCNALTIVDVSSFDTHNVVNMAAMFQYCSNLTTLNIRSFDTSSVSGTSDIQGMYSMFYGCTNLQTLFLDADKFDTSNVYSMYFMFYNCKNLTSIDTSKFDTSNCHFMNNMFCNCKELELLDLRTFNTSNVTNMKYLFAGCNKLTNIVIDTAKFKTNNVTDMSYMFDDCNLLETFDDSKTKIDFSKFNTSLVQNFSSMFSDCDLFETLDLSSFVLPSNTKTNYMFSSMDNIKKIDMRNFDLSNITSSSNLFELKNLKKLEEVVLPKGISIANIDLPTVTGKEWKGYDIKNKLIPGAIYTTLPSSNDGGNSTFESGELFKIKLKGPAQLLYDDTANNKKYYEDGYKENGVLIEDSLKATFDLSENQDESMMAYLYSDGTLIFDGVGYYDEDNKYHANYGDNVSNYLDIKNYSLYNSAKEYSEYASTITRVRFSNNGYKPNNMSYAFFGLYNLTDIDFTNLDTSELKYVDYMFAYCTSLESLDLSSLNFSNVFAIRHMFEGCINLEELSMGYMDEIDTDSDDVADNFIQFIDYVFTGCTKLKKLDLSGLRFSLWHDTNPFGDPSEIEDYIPDNIHNIIFGPTDPNLSEMYMNFYEQLENSNPDALLEIKLPYIDSESELFCLVGTVDYDDLSDDEFANYGYFDNDVQLAAKTSFVFSNDKNGTDIVYNNSLPKMNISSVNLVSNDIATYMIRDFKVYTDPNTNLDYYFNGTIGKKVIANVYSGTGSVYLILYEDGTLLLYGNGYVDDIVEYYEENDPENEDIEHTIGEYIYNASTLIKGSDIDVTRIVCSNNFDAALVTIESDDDFTLFSNLTELKSVDFSNANLKNWRYLLFTFFGDTNLETVDLSGVDFSSITEQKDANGFFGINYSARGLIDFFTIMVGMDEESIYEQLSEMLHIEINDFADLEENFDLYLAAGLSGMMDTIATPLPNFKEIILPSDVPSGDIIIGLPYVPGKVFYAADSEGNIDYSKTYTKLVKQTSDVYKLVTCKSALYVDDKGTTSSSDDVLYFDDGTNKTEGDDAITLVKSWDLTDTTSITPAGSLMAYLYSDGMMIFDGKGNNIKYTSYEPWYNDYVPGISPNIKCNKFITKVAFSDNGFKPTSLNYMFNSLYNCTEFLNMDKLDTSQCKTFVRAFAFYNADDINNNVYKTLDLSHFDFSGINEPTDAFSYMFDNSRKLENIIWPDTMNTSNVTRLDHMFAGCKALSSNSINDFIDKFDTTNIGSLLWAFDATQVDDKFNTLLRKIDLSKVSWQGLCAGIYKATYIDLSNSNFTNTAKCIHPKNLNGFMCETYGVQNVILNDDMTIYDFSRVTDYSTCFNTYDKAGHGGDAYPNINEENVIHKLCYDLFDFTSTQTMSQMFRHASSLRKIDLTKFKNLDTTGTILTNTGQLFQEDFELQEVKFPENFTIGSIGEYTFYNLFHIENINWEDVTVVNPINVTKNYVLSNMGSNTEISKLAPKYDFSNFKFTGDNPSGVFAINMSAKEIVMPQDTASRIPFISALVKAKNNYDYFALDSDGNTLYKLKAATNDQMLATRYNPTDAQKEATVRLVQGNLLYRDDYNNTPSNKNDDRLYYDCGTSDDSITLINSWDITKVGVAPHGSPAGSLMVYLYSDGTMIFDGEGVNKYYVYSERTVIHEYRPWTNSDGSYSLDEDYHVPIRIVISDNGFKPTNLDSLFANYKGTKFYNFDKLDTSSCSSMNHTFIDNPNLEELDVSNFVIGKENEDDTKYVISMENTFECGSNDLLEIKGLDKLDTSRVKYMTYMFYNASKNINFTLNLSNFDTSSAETFYGMFGNLNVTSLNLSNFVTTNVTNMSSMFKGCSSLDTVKIKLNDTALTYASEMFDSCSKLKTIDLTGSTITKNKLPLSNVNSLVKVVLPETISSNISLYTKDGHYKWVEANSSFNPLTPEVTHDKLIAMSSETNGAKTLVRIDDLLYDDGVTEYYRDGTNNESITLVKTISLSPLTKGNLKAYIYSDKMMILDGEGQLGEYDTFTDSKKSQNVTKIAISNNGFKPDKINVNWNYGIFKDAYYVTDIYQFDKLVKPLDCTDMSSLFEECYSLTNIGFTSASATFDTTGVTEMNGMFESCYSLADFSILDRFTDYSSVTNISCMFEHCNAATELDLSNLNFGSVSEMAYLFKGCINATTIKLPSTLDTSSVEEMDYLFEYCFKLEEIEGLDKLDTSSVTCFEGMFSVCKSLSGTLNLSNFEFSDGLEYLDLMFAECFNLEKIIFKDNLVIPSGCETYCMFEHCHNLNQIQWDGLTFNWNGYRDIDGMFDGCNNLETLDLSGFNLDNLSDNTLLWITYDNDCSQIRNYNCYCKYDMDEYVSIVEVYNALENPTIMDYYDAYGYILDIESFGDCVSAGPYKFNKIILPTSVNSASSKQQLLPTNGVREKWVEADSLFNPLTPNVKHDTLIAKSTETNGAKTLVRINDVLYKDSSNVEYYRDGTSSDGITLQEAYDISLAQDHSMYAYLYSNNTLIYDGTGENINYFVSNTDSSKLRPWKDYLDSIDKIVISNNGFKPTNIDSLFASYKGTTLYQFDKLDTSECVSMQCAFNGSDKLTSIDLSKFNTSKVTNMNYMFAGCSKLTSLNLSKFDTSKVENFGCMFSFLNISSLDLSYFDTSSATDMYCMFWYTRGLSSIDISNFDTSHVTDMTNMFKDCLELTSVKMKVNDSALRSCSSIFLNDSKLTTLDLTGSTITGNVFDLSTGSALTKIILPDSVASATANDSSNPSLPTKTWVKFKSNGDAYNSTLYTTLPAKTASGDYLGTAIPLSQCTFSACEVEYDGTAKKPDFAGLITFNTTTLVPGTDYTVSDYANNVEAGTATCTITGKGAYTGKKENVSFTIKPKAISVNLGASDYEATLKQQKDYDSTTNADSKSLTINGVTYQEEGSDTPVTEIINISLTASYDIPDAGDRNMIYHPEVTSVTGGHANVSNYLVSFDNIDGSNNVTLNNYGKINGLEIHYTLSNFTKVYDGNSDITLTITLDDPSGILEGQTIGNEGTDVIIPSSVHGTFDDKNVGSDKSITIDTITLTGDKSGNYYLVPKENVKGTINQKLLTYQLGSLDKTFDGTNTNNNVTVTNLEGIESIDEGKVTISSPITATFISSNVGTYYSEDHTSYVPDPSNKVSLSEITLRGTESGDESGNYRIEQPTSYSGTISALGLTSDMFKAISDMTYTGSEIKPSLEVSDDYISKLNLTNDIEVTYSDNIDKGEATVTISPKDGGNFENSANVTLHFEILAKDIEVNLADAKYSTLLHQEKTYDGTDAGKDDLSIQADGVTGETLVITLTSTYEDKNVGTKDMKYVPSFSSVTGGRCKTSNYNVTYTNINDGVVTLDDYGTITQKEISYTTQTTKVYDGNNTSSTVITLNESDIISSDIGKVTVVTPVAGTYDDELVGDNKVVTPTNSVLTLEGEERGNYKVNDLSNLTGSITLPGSDRLIVDAINSVTYNGSSLTPALTIKYDVDGDGTGDILLESGTDYDADYSNNINAGTANVSITYKGNYTGTDSKTFTIDPRPVTINLNSFVETFSLTQEKIYDATVNPDADDNAKSITYTDPGVTTGEVLRFDLAGVYDSKNVGTRDIIYTVTFTSVTSPNGLTSNYDITYSNGVTTDGITKVTLADAGEITQKDITRSDYDLTIKTKAYDGNATTTIENFSLHEGVIFSGDNVTVDDYSSCVVTLSDSKEGTHSISSISPVPTISGDDSANYNLIFTYADDKGTIAKDVLLSEMFETISDVIYNGTAYEIVPTITSSYASKLTSDDYTLSWSNNIDASTTDNKAKVTITAKDGGNYSGSVTLEFTIKQKDITVDLNDNTTYTGSVTQEKVYNAKLNADSKSITTSGVNSEVINIPLKGSYTTKVAGETKEINYVVDESIGMTVTGGEGKISNYNVIINNLTGNYGKITKKPVAYTLVINDKVFDGNDKTTIKSLTINDGVIESNESSVLDDLSFGDYSSTVVTLASSANGTHLVTGISPVPELLGDDKDNYSLDFKYDGITGTITNKVIPDDGDGLTITNTLNEDNEVMYTGLEIPIESLGITISDSVKTLTLGTDYELSYTSSDGLSTTDAVNVGSDKRVYIKGIGDYAGETYTTFTIIPKDITYNDLIMSDKLKTDNTKDLTKYVNGKQNRFIHYGTDELEIYYLHDINGTTTDTSDDYRINFNYSDAYISDSSKAIIPFGDLESSKSLKNIVVNNLSPSTTESNYRFIVSAPNEYMFTNKGYLVDNTAPTIVSLVTDNTMYGKDQTITFTMTLSEEIDAIDNFDDVKLKLNIDNLYNKVATLTNVTYDAENTSSGIENDNITKTILEFSYTIDITEQVHTYHIYPQLGIVEEYVTDVSGNELDIAIPSSYDNEIEIDTNGFSIDITHDKTLIDNIFTKDDEIIYTIKINTPNNVATSDSDVKDAIKIYIGDSNYENYVDKSSDYIDNIVKVNDKEYKVTIDTTTLIEEDDTLGKSIKVKVDSETITDNLGNKNSAKENVLKVIRTLEPTLTITYDGKELTRTSDGKMIDSNGNEVLIFNNDKVTITSLVTNAIIKYKDMLNTSSYVDTSSNTLVPKNILEFIVTKTNYEITSIYEFLSTWAKSDEEGNLIFRIKTLSDLVDETNKNISDNKLNDLSNVLLNEKNILLLDESDTSSDLTTDEKSMLNDASHALDISKELARRVKDDDLVNSDSDPSDNKNTIDETNIEKEIKDIIKGLKDRDEFLDDIDPVDISSLDEEDIETLMINYTFQEGWVRTLLDDYPKVIELKEAYQALIGDNETVSLVSDDDEVTIYGVVNRSSKESIDDLLKLIVRPIVDNPEFDTIKSDLESYLVNPNEKVLQPYDIKLVNVTKGNSLVQPKEGTSMLVTIELPKEYTNRIIHVYHEHDPISDNDIKVTKYKDKCYVEFYTDSFSNFTLTTDENINSVIISKENEIGGNINPDSKVIINDLVTKGINELQFTISLNKDYKAEIYRDGTKVKELTSSGIYTLDKLDEINTNVFIKAKFVKVEPKKDDDDNPKKDITTQTITVQVANHIPYINGYGDNTFRPNKDMTRAEFSKVISTISNNFSTYTFDKTNVEGYKDVKDNAWYSKYVGYMTKTHLMSGYPDGTFKPNDPITRAEVCKVLSSMFNMPVKDVENIFYNELNGHWYFNSTNKMIKAGYVNGYPDGTFKPNKDVTRAEAVSLINRVKDRAVNKDKNISSTYKNTLNNKYKDVKESNWFYNDLLEASVAHSSFDLH